ncbi:MAG TPA: phosphoglycerate mutase family protein [Allosphingosinicella sp.]|jgi:phosphohistidine phosphatase SixA
MTLFRPMATLLLLMVAACATTAPDREPERAPVAYYVMRHLQKAEGPDPLLSAEGMENARRLSRFFTADPPRAIYVSSTRRASETAVPLSASLSLPAHVYNPADTPGLIARVKKEAGPVLIVGHSNTVPEIVAGLGGARPADLAETDYGDIFRVRRDGSVERLRLE